METKEIIIRLKENCTDAAVCIKTNQSTLTKTVEFSEVLSKLTSTISINTGILPLGTRLYIGTKNNYQILIEIPGKIRDFKYLKQEIHFEGKVPFPSCVMFFEINNSTIVNSKAFALREPIFSEETQLYNFPFGNTYSDGNICWGSAEKEKIKKPLDLISCISSFMNSTYNGDLFYSSAFNYNFNPDLLKGNFISLLNFLKDKEIFPKELLVKNEYSIEQILRRGNE